MTEMDIFTVMRTVIMTVTGVSECILADQQDDISPSVPYASVRPIQSLRERGQANIYKTNAANNQVQYDIRAQIITDCNVNFYRGDAMTYAQNSNWESWIADVLGRTEAGTENAIATANGLDGSGATAATAAGSSTTLTAAELARLVGSLTDGYNVLGECGFLMKNATKWYLKGLTGSNFNFIATPAGADFFGYPAYVSDDMAAMTSGLYSTLFGNFNYFAVVEKPGMLVQRNPYLLS